MVKIQDLLKKIILAITLAKTLTKEIFNEDCFSIVKGKCSNCQTNVLSDYEFDISVNTDFCEDLKNLTNSKILVEYRIIFPDEFQLWLEDKANIILSAANKKIDYSDNDDNQNYKEIVGFKIQRGIIFNTTLKKIINDHNLIIKDIDNPSKFGYLKDFDFELTLNLPKDKDIKNESSTLSIFKKYKVSK